MKKKFLAGVLAFAMLVACMSVSVSAARYSEEGGLSSADSVTEKSRTDLLQRLKSEAGEDGWIKLEDDVTISDADGNFILNLDVKIDLNGHKLDLGKTAETANTIGTYNGSTLEIKDSSEGHTGKLVGTVKAQFNSSVTLTDVNVEGTVVATAQQSGEEFTNTNTLLTITGGSIKSGESSALTVAGCTATVTNTTIECAYSDTGAGCAVNVQNGSEGSRASLTMTGCTVKNTAGSGVLVSGYSDFTAENCTIEAAGSFGICSNGSDNDMYKSAKINIVGGSVKGGAIGMYLPSVDGETTVDGASVEGKTGIEIRAGKLNVIDSTVTGSEETYTSQKNGGGATSSGGGIVVAEHETGEKIVVNISGDKTHITGAVALAIDNPNDIQDAGKNYEIRIEDGKFQSNEEGKSAVEVTDKVTEKGQDEDPMKGAISGGSFISGEKADENVKQYLDANLTLDESGNVADFDPEGTAVFGIANANGDVETEVAIGEADGDGFIELSVGGTISASHSAASPSNTWWAGVGFKAPEGATKVSYKSGDAEEYTEQEFLDTLYLKDGSDARGFGLWLDGTTFPKEGRKIELRWADEEKALETTRYILKLSDTVELKPFATEIVDFGYNADAEAAKSAASEGRKLASGASSGEEWIETLDWASKTMWLTFKDPVPNGITINVEIATPSGAAETVACAGNGKAYTFAWSYDNHDQTGDTSVEVGKYVIGNISAEETASKEPVSIDVTVSEGKASATVPAGEIALTVVDAGFKADAEAAKKAIDDKWDGDDRTDVAPNTMWVIFEQDPAQDEGQTYTVNVLKDDKIVHTEDVSGVKRAGLVYICLDQQLKEVENKTGEYVFQIVKDGVAVASKVVKVYRVEFAAGENVTFAEDAVTGIYSGEDDLDAAKEARPNAKLSSGNNTLTWSEETSEDGYTITVTATGSYVSPSSPSPSPSTDPTTAKVEETEGGSVKLSSTTAKAGTDVTVTVTPDKGYEVGEVTVTDKDGNPVELTKNEDGTFTFTMPTATPVTVKAVFNRIDASAMFVDVASDVNKWYVDDLQDLLVNHPGLIGGDLNSAGERVFRPHDGMTRGEFAKIVYTMAGGKPVDIENHFTDLKEGDWYYDYILWANSEGIILGTGTDTVSPEDLITRDQAVAMLNRWLDEPKAENADVLDAFHDASEVEEYALDAMAWAVENNIVGGTTEGNLKPTDEIERCEMVAILARYFKSVTE